jgi:hypothetical protein
VRTASTHEIVREACRKLTFLLLVVAIASGTAWTQYSTASLAGTVTDPGGAAVPDATVGVHNLETGFEQTQTTGAEGNFNFPLLPVGTYSIRVDKTGFSAYHQQGIILAVRQSATVEVKMTVGALSEKVNVQADAEMVDLRTATDGQLIDQRKVLDLPLNTRRPQNLIYLTAGSVDLARMGFSPSGNGFVQPSVNGAGNAQVNYQMDGAGNNDVFMGLNQPFPNPDAVQEFKIDTSNFSAEFGNAGGAVVNIVTKSGSNTIHGSLFEFLRNGDLNARNFFAIAPDTLKRNQFGGSVGGPIIKNKLFYFGTYQGGRSRTDPSGMIAFVPTAPERQGDFSGTTTAVMDPLTGLPFPGNKVPGSRLSSVTQYILNYIPLPNRPGGELDFTGTKIQQDENEVMGRVDYYWRNVQLNGRYYWNHNDHPVVIAKENLLAADSGGDLERSPSTAINHTITLSPALVLTGTFGYARTNGSSISSSPFGYPDAGVKIASSAEGVLKARPEIELFTPNFSVYTNHQGDFNRESFTIRESLLLIKGNHELHFGGEVVRLTNHLLNTFFQDGSFTFSGQITGESMADFMIGRASSFNQGGGEFKNLSGATYGFFVQDNWRVTSRLNLTAGLRWDPFLPPYDHDGRVVCFERGVQSSRYPNAPLGLTFGGSNHDSGCPVRGAENNFSNFAPRVGFAYRLTNDSKTAIRGGAGLYYSSPPSVITNAFSDDAPFSPQIGLNDVAFADPYGSAGVANPFPAQFAPRIPGPEATFPIPTSVTYLDTKFRSSLLTTWSLNVERQLAQSWVVRVGYVGNKGTHLQVPFLGSNQDINAAVYVPGDSTVGNTQARRPLQQFTSINAVQSAYNSNYHAFQTSVEKRFGHGLTLLANYTWSKKIDDIGMLYGRMTDPFNRAFDRGLANDDVPHNFRFSNVWEIPRFGGNRSFDRLLNGWMLNSIVTWQSGLPFTVTSGQDNSFSGIGADRADFFGGKATLDSGRSHGELISEFFDISKFTVNRVGTFGNAGKNVLFGPRLFNTDFNIVKNTRITERVNIQLRGEFFNLFNNVNFKNPNANVSSGAFGKITSVLDPRIVQLGLKVLF